jgi:hypothetical protein
MFGQDEANRARAIGALIAIAAVLVVLAWKYLTR